MTAALPKAIQAQMEAADAIEAQIQLEVNPEAPPAQPAVNTPEAPVLEAPQPAPAQPPAPVAQQPAQEPQQPAPANDDDGYKAKYLTLEGKYRAEVPRLAAQVRELNELTAQLLKERNTPAQPATPPQAQPEQPLVSPTDAEEFGGDLMTAVARVASEAAQRAVAQALDGFKREVGVVQQQVGKVAERVEKSAEEQFWDRVRGHVSDWDAVDADLRWVEFLNTSPKFSTLTYRQLAAGAVQDGAPDKIAEIVELWKATLPPQPQSEQPPAQPQPPAAPKPNLAAQQAPTHSHASPPPQPAGKIWSRAEYEEVYDPRWIRRVGPEESAKQQAAADQAVAEGRVRFV